MSSDSGIDFDREGKPLRRRLRRREALGLDWNNLNDDVEETATAELVPPRMYEVYLDSKEAKKFGRNVGWNGIMPLASNVNVHVGDAELAPSHRATQNQPWLSEASRLNSQVMFDSIKGAILSGLELLSLYNRRAERELRARNNDRHDLAIVSHIPETPLDPKLPRELVTGVTILMPSVPRTSNGKQESWKDSEERLPDAAIGLTDKEWKGRIDVKAGKATRRSWREIARCSRRVARRYASQREEDCGRIWNNFDRNAYQVVGWPLKKAEPNDLKAYAEELKPKL
ncbi:hypothetical protein FS837_006444 [Tulasnella sp. UAMH 9824]|nr:hypothetical protein FS837_006444 [Tulasnella sp. UAMH 9824]